MSINTKVSKNNGTGVHWAVENKKIKWLNFFIDKNANIKIPDDEGHTPVRFSKIKRRQGNGKYFN